MGIKLYGCVKLLKAEYCPESTMGCDWDFDRLLWPVQQEKQ